MVDAVALRGSSEVPGLLRADALPSWNYQETKDRGSTSSHFSNPQVESGTAPSNAQRPILDIWGF